MEYKLLNLRGLFLLFLAIVSFIIVATQSSQKLWMQISTTHYQSDELDQLSLEVSDKTIPVQFRLNVDKTDAENLYLSKQNEYENIEHFLCDNILINLLNNYYRIDEDDIISFFKMTIPFTCEIDSQTDSTFSVL